MIEITTVIVVFSVLVFGVGPVLMPAWIGTPLVRVVVGLAASLGLIYLVGFLLYVCAAPTGWHRGLLVLPVVVGVIRHRAWRELVADPAVRQAIVVWAIIATWLLGWLLLVQTYSGATWHVDWYEHYHRALFFIERWDVGHRFVGIYSIAARPPLINLVMAELMHLSGVGFPVYQVACVLLASLIVWPVLLWQQRWSRPGEAPRVLWTVVLLMGLPALAQNAVFAWTKVPTAFFVLIGVAMVADPAMSWRRLTVGGLALTSGLLAHYSAAPWLLALGVAGVAWLIWQRQLPSWRAVVVPLVASAMLFGTWLTWSLVRLGPAETFGSNSTVVSGEGLEMGERLSQGAANLYYTSVPVFFRSIEYGGYRAQDGLVQLRDHYFNGVQSSWPLLAGLLGVVAAMGLVWRERHRLDPATGVFWAVLLGVGLLVGIVVHTSVVEMGVAHVCLLPGAFLVVAWLAARVPGHRRWQRLLLGGVAIDVVLGIILHFGVQSLGLLRWLHPGLSDDELVQRLGHAARENWRAKETFNLTFVGDLPGAAVMGGWLLLLAVLLALGLWWGRGEGRPAPRTTIAARPVAAWERKLALALFVACLGFHLWGVRVGWTNRNLPGVEFRQAQTALSAYWIHAERNFDLAYPTPVLGSPWSIPMEFPLYQWTVAAVSHLTQLSLTKSGRLVSIVCFYLSLPAILLLLGRWRVPWTWRWLVGAVVLTCPLYIFYSRAFLIETMALMLGLWFWVAYERGIAGRHLGWATVAAVVGAGVGLVKVTTFILFLLPVTVWAAARWWRAPRGDRGREMVWMGATIVPAFALTHGWVHYADAVKAFNPLAQFLLSSELREFNFGTWAMRLNGDVWRMQARIIAEEITWLPAIGLAALAWVIGGRSQTRAILTCLGTFAAVLVIFPLLYALHDYYFVANSVLLLLAMGLALAGWLQSGRWRGGAWAVALAVPLLQGWRYSQHYYAEQALAAPDGNGLTEALRHVTAADEVIVILGEDWNSMTPYFARRRALMLRDDIARDADKVEAALQRLDGEKLGALLITGDPDGRQWLIDQTARRGLSREPLAHWNGTAVYFPAAREDELRDQLLDTLFGEVRLDERLLPSRADLANDWIKLSDLRLWQQRPFEAMTPRPVRFFCTFGPALDASSGVAWFGAHPVTRLIFELPAGPHTLRSTLQMPPETYHAGLSDSEASDGVEVALYALGPGGVRHRLDGFLFDPRHRPEHRGASRPLVFTFELQHPGEVELFIGPGPQGRDTRDWIELGPLVIE